jgi:hypothetical protein
MIETPGQYSLEQQVKDEAFYREILKEEGVDVEDSTCFSRRVDRYIEALLMGGSVDSEEVVEVAISIAKKFREKMKKGEI